MNKIDLTDYVGFVDSVTSDRTKNPEDLINRIKELSEQNPNLSVSRLLTAGAGLAGEGGEFNDVAKKVVFHDKPWTDELHAEMVKELGDILWYWAQGCMALGIDPYEAVQGNIDKLSKRYPGGFDAWRSENRDPEDK
jgi:NTP pyrophosphatase (non-canonical NTP hydrolase)